MRSIRWRLVLSFVFLTLLTVSVLGAFTYALVKQNIEEQEIEFLRSNAEAVARQALPLLQPQVQQSALEELASTTSFLGNVRVKILDDRGQVLVDTGPPTEIDRFMWIQNSDGEFLTEPFDSLLEPFILPVPLPDGNETPSVSERQPLVEGFPPEIRYRFIRRAPMPWGNRVIFEDDPLRTANDMTFRSDIVFTLPIVEDDNLLGFVELLDGPNLGTDILRNFSRAFLMAATGSVLLAVVVVLVMARRLTTPLISLTNTVSQMEGGDLAARAPDYGKDEIGLLARQFNQMATRLETSFADLAAERDTLRRFIADASHELRTPITALKNFNELLQGKAADDSEARVEFLAESETQLDRLDWITTNLLSISRLESGLTPLVVEIFDVSELLSAIVSPFKIRAEAKGINFEVILPEPPFKIFVDRALIELAVHNLLDNAIKFTPTGGHVKLGASRVEDTVHLWVHDNGDGIDHEDLPHIFERFYRSRKTTVEGSGLGLAMVESVVLAHEGKISVESELGTGSNFLIELPYEVKSSEEDSPSGNTN
jgi:signal transduction histidine kinase